MNRMISLALLLTMLLTPIHAQDATLANYTSLESGLKQDYVKETKAWIDEADLPDKYNWNDMVKIDELADLVTSIFAKDKIRYLTADEINNSLIYSGMVVSGGIQNKLQILIDAKVLTDWDYMEFSNSDADIQRVYALYAISKLSDFNPYPYWSYNKHTEDEYLIRLKPNFIRDVEMAAYRSGIYDIGSDLTERITFGELYQILYIVSNHKYNLKAPGSIDDLIEQLRLDKTAHEQWETRNEILYELCIIKDIYVERFIDSGFTLEIVDDISDYYLTPSDTVVGATDYTEKLILVSEDSYRYPDNYIVVHEIGHFVEYDLDLFSITEKLWHEEKANIVELSRDYAAEGMNELFAEAFQVAMINRFDTEWISRFKIKAPLAYKVFKTGLIDADGAMNKSVVFSVLD